MLTSRAFMCAVAAVCGCCAVISLTAGSVGWAVYNTLAMLACVFSAATAPNS